MEASFDNINVPNEVLEEKKEKIREELFAESERACAIVGGAYLGELLGELLEHYLVENKTAGFDLLNSENVNAPLSGFGARILIAYAIGLLSKESYDALLKIKKIRNKFAHDLTLSFSDPSISKLCKDLTPLMHDPLLNERTSRDVFIHAVILMSGYLLQLIYLTKNVGLKGSYTAVLRSLSKKRLYNNIASKKG